MDKTNILLWRADQAGCGWARIDLIAAKLNEHFGETINAKPSMIMNPKEWVDLDSKGIIIKKNLDLTVHQRQYGTPNLKNFHFLQDKLHVPCVYEIDDYLHGVSKMSTAYHAYNPNIQKDRFTNIDTYLTKSDAVTVTTEYLKTLYSSYNKNIYVLPNCIDFKSLYTDDIRKLREKHRKDHEKKKEIWIGWAGSNTHLPDLLIIVDAIKQILNDYPNVKLALGGWDGAFRNAKGVEVTPALNPWRDIPEDRKVCIPWASDMKDYPKMLAQFDIGLAPLEDNDFNRAKSNIKLLEYGACGVPVICSDVEPYSRTIQSGINGYKIKIKGAVHHRWYKKIKQLVEDKQLRLQVAENLTKYVQDNYDIDKEIYRWKDCYEEVIEKRKKEIREYVQPPNTILENRQETAAKEIKRRAIAQGAGSTGQPSFYNPGY